MATCEKCGEEMPYDDSITVCETCGREAMLSQHEQVPGARTGRRW